DHGCLEVELVDPVRAEGAEVPPVALQPRPVACAGGAPGTEHGVAGLPAELVRGHHLAVDPPGALLAERIALLHREPRVLDVHLRTALDDRGRSVGIGQAESEAALVVDVLGAQLARSVDADAHRLAG